MPPQPPSSAGPKWARKRIVIPAAVLTLFVGVGIGSAGGGETEKTSAEAKPQPTVTVTETAAAAKPAKDEAKPAPTVTVTKTVKPKADDKPADPPADEADAPAGEVVFKVWGSAPSGVDINYGSDSDSRSGKGLPFEKTLKLDDSALYYNVNAQLMGGGDINCSVTVNGETKKGHASGDYNICMAQVNGGLLGGWS
ncbi:MmpS family transport accessory protein [Streptomyces sp. NPDC048376]|uniref:MmpS family transport accessory protein n=1 Tax=Streptomyces sp. NPDC048376 TaxID=3154926 RepID=UPI003446E007